MVFKWLQRSQSNRSYWSVPCFKENKLTLFLTSSFQSSLKTTITFWCFVFVTLFNLQGTCCVPQRFLMISLRFPFVKNFFQKLFSFFQALSFARSWSSITAALAGDLVRIPYSVRLVKNFFEFFKLFSSSFGCLTWQEKTVSLNWPFVLALPIFPARLQASIFGAGELNFRVRDGNGWTLTAINTNLLSFEKKSKQKKL